MRRSGRRDEEHALTPEAVEAVIALTERDDVRARKDVLATEHVDVDRRIRRLVAMIETDAGDVACLVARVRELEAKRDALVRDLAHF